MKLKRLLSGVTAAIMALSSVAIASFTYASASELADNAFIQWSGKWVRVDGKDPAGSDQTGLIDKGTSKGGMLVENWGSGWQLKISEIDLTGMKNPSIEVEISDGGTFQVYTEKDDGKGGTVPDVNFGIGKSGEPVLIPEDYRGESASFLLSALDASGAITKISVYDHPNPPAQPGAFESIDYNCTIVSGGDTIVTFGDPEGTNRSIGLEVGTSGDFKLERQFSTPLISLSGLGVIEASPNPITIKVNSIVVNDTYTFDVGLEIASDSDYGNTLPHIYDGITINTAVIYKCADAYIAGGSNIKLMLGAPPEAGKPGQSQSSSKTYSGTTYNAQLSYCDSAISFDARGNDKTYGGPIAEIGGTYTLGINVSDFKNWVDQVPSGITCLYIDMLGMAKAFGANTTVGVEKGKKEDFDATRALAVSKGLSVTNLSIITDGKEFYKYKDSDIYFGDFEANGNLRINLINLYSLPPCPNALDGISPYFSATDKIEVKFTIKTPLTKSSNTVSKNPTIPTNTPITIPNIIKVNTITKPVNIVNTKKVTKPGKPKITYTFNPKTNKIKVKWKKVKGATGYQYKIALTKKFKKAKKKLINKKSFTYKLKFNQKYTIGVRAYKIVGNIMYYGKWTTKKIRLKKV